MTSNVIRNVPALNWGTGQQTTYCGALAAALRAARPQRTYVELMGDSALAFRTRWWRAHTGPGWCPSSPVGEFEPWTNLAQNSVGWNIRWIVHMDGNTDMSRYKPDVVASIDAGVPVLAYSTTFDMSVIYGYDDGGDTVLVRDYYKGDEETRLPLSQNKGFLGILTDRREPPVRAWSILRALKQATTDWTGWKPAYPFGNPAGEYHLGREAYNIWINDLKSSGELSPEDLKKLFHPSWWTFTTLADARAAAAIYLRESAALLPDSIQPALHRAANLFAQAAELASIALKDNVIFFGPFSGRPIEDWTSDVRQREAKLLEELKALDAAAIAQIQTTV